MNYVGIFSVNVTVHQHDGNTQGQSSDLLCTTCGLVLRVVEYEVSVLLDT